MLIAWYGEIMIVQIISVDVQPLKVESELLKVSNAY